MMIHLKKQTTFTLMTFALFALALMLHLLAFATDHWCVFTLDEIRVNLGLWHGCWETNDGIICSPAVFEYKAFTTGLSNDWHIGARIVMTLPMITLVVLEFAIIGYACLLDLNKYNRHFSFTVILTSYGTAGCHFIVLLLYGTEATKLPQGELKWSFGMVVLAFLIELGIPILIHGDKIRDNFKSKTLKVTKQIRVATVKSNDTDATIVRVIRDAHAVRDTREKDTSEQRNSAFDNGGEYLEKYDHPTRTSRANLTSLTEYTRRFSYTGSIEDSSLFTQSTEFSTLSYGNGSSYSVESFV
ncbi:hypothetical protein ACJMK2_041914 [Sinanodonta woodiana]|uniref:Uncharacterized protein n=1 Tax=Sinanodonta woodiana TaxID=1069815 RepID=A0ABD3W5Q6_SINWO